MSILNPEGYCGAYKVILQIGNRKTPKSNIDPKIIDILDFVIMLSYFEMKKKVIHPNCSWDE
jgi:hypothetical protein